MGLNYIDELLEHMKWADYILWQTLFKTPNADKDGRLKEIMLHYHFTQFAFLKIWKDEQFVMPNEKEFADLKSIFLWNIGYYNELFCYTSRLKEEEYSRILSIPWVKYIEERLGKQAENVSLAESIIQLALHSSHHRGQVNSMIRGLGGEPPLVDYIAWVWLGKPEIDSDKIINVK